MHCLVCLVLIAICHGLSISEDELAKKLERMQKQLDEQSQKIQQLESMRLPSTHDMRDDNRVAFSAFRDTVATVGAYQKMVLDKTYVNYGGHYNTETGEFTCPIDGVYYFTATAGQDQNNNLAMQICMDDQYYLAAFADYRNWDQGAISLIIDCPQGSKVYVRQGRDDSTEYGHNANGPITNAFVGYLLYY